MSEAGEAEKSPLKGGCCGQPNHADGVVAVGVFGKHWTPWQTKTRLAASIGAPAAAAASRMFLEASLERLASVAGESDRRVLAYSPLNARGEFEGLRAVASGAWQLEPQSPGNLGARMASFFRGQLQTAQAALLVGSDSPHMPLHVLRDAAAWLKQAGAGPRLVLGPTSDGGYWTVGASGAVPPIFEAMPWSDPGLFEATLRRLDERGWREGADFRIVASWYDVDDADDLARMRATDLAEDPALVTLRDQLDDLLGPVEP